VRCRDTSNKQAQFEEKINKLVFVLSVKLLRFSTVVQCAVSASGFWFGFRSEWGSGIPI